MLTEDKVTELFCIADDFCKFFDAMMTKYTLKPTMKRSYHRDSTMSKAEIMLIMILFHDSGYRCLKHFYIKKVCKHLRHLFPKVVSYNRFVELEKEVAIPLALFIKKVLLGKCTGISFVVLDGIRDLVYDINSPSEATSIISKLMQWTDLYQIHLHTILHQNKSDENARGHIGTEINNKAESVIQVEKDKMDSSVSTVSPVNMRQQDFQTFAFRVNDDLLPELDDDYVPSSSATKRPSKQAMDFYRDIKESQHRAALSEAFAGDDGRLVVIGSYNELQNKLKTAYKNQGFALGNNKIIELTTFLTNKRMIEKPDNGRGYRYLEDCYY